MHLTTTALPYLKFHVTQSRDLRKKIFLPKFYLPNLVHIKSWSALKNFFSGKNSCLKKCAVVRYRLDASTINQLIVYPIWLCGVVYFLNSTHIVRPYSLWLVALE